MRRFVFAALATSCSFSLLPAQEVISAQAGLLHHVEGRVLLDNAPVRKKPGQFAHMKDNSVLTTEAGRVELLLSPGTALRLSENASLRLVSRRLSDIRVELLSGVAFVEVSEESKETQLQLRAKGLDVVLRKSGLYRLDATAGTLQTHDGEAQVQTGDAELKVKEGWQVAAGNAKPTKFDTTRVDPLQRWAKRRSSYLALASYSSARTIFDSGQNWTTSAWAYNPYYGFYTYVPVRGLQRSPFGYQYCSPLHIQIANQAPTMPWNPGMGMPDRGSYPGNGGGGSINMGGGSASGGGGFGGGVPSGGMGGGGSMGGRSGNGPATRDNVPSPSGPKVQ